MEKIHQFWFLQYIRYQYFHRLLVLRPLNLFLIELTFKHEIMVSLYDCEF